MDIILHGLGAIMIAWFGVSFMMEWSGNRSHLLSDNNEIGVHILAIVVGIGIFFAPYALYANIDPSLEITTTDTHRTISPMLDRNDISIVVNGVNVPVTINASFREEVCSIRLKRDYPLMVIRDLITTADIVGTSCSDIPSIIDHQQIRAILTGWGMSIEGVSVGHNSEY